MSELTHITKCTLCQDFQISARGFDPIPIMGGTSNPRVDAFGLELYGHLQKEAAKEAKRLQKTQGNGHQAPSTPLEAAQFMFTHARHLAALQGVIQTTQWAQRFAVLMGFETTDEELLKAKEGSRYALHAITRKPGVQFTDEKLREIAQAVWDSSNDTNCEESIFETLRQIRDALVEPTPPEMQQAPLVSL